jgi:hypothetical protein
MPTLNLAVLADCQAQTLLFMDHPDICNNTLNISKECRSFLLAENLNLGHLGGDLKEQFDSILDYTLQIEEILLFGGSEFGYETRLMPNQKRIKLKAATDNIHQCCKRIEQSGPMIAKTRKLQIPPRLTK